MRFDLRNPAHQMWVAFGLVLVFNVFGGLRQGRRINGTIVTKGGAFPRTTVETLDRAGHPQDRTVTNEKGVFSVLAQDGPATYVRLTSRGYVSEVRMMEPSEPQQVELMVERDLNVLMDRNVIQPKRGYGHLWVFVNSSTSSAGQRIFTRPAAELTLVTTSTDGDWAPGRRTVAGRENMFLVLNVREGPVELKVRAHKERRCQVDLMGLPEARVFSEVATHVVVECN